MDEITLTSQEALCIGDQITLTILFIRSNQVQLGFNAPKTLAIHRSEIYLKIQTEVFNTQHSGRKR